jgi:hypothetical protein
MIEPGDRSEIILDRVNDVCTGEGTLVNCVLAHGENRKEYSHESLEDLLTRIRISCHQRADQRT